MLRALLIEKDQVQELVLVVMLAVVREMGKVIRKMIKQRKKRNQYQWEKLLYKMELFHLYLLVFLFLIFLRKMLGMAFQLI
jgi:hypothetical protein